MCEFCRESWSQEMAVFGFACEFVSEEFLALCNAPAAYQLKERYVEDHLCEQHGQIGPAPSENAWHIIFVDDRKRKGSEQ